MKSFKLVLGLGMLAVASTASADSTVTTVIDGTKISKDLTKLTFSDKTVTLTFSDNSTETADMNLVAITLDHAGQSAITDIIADPAKRKRRLQPPRPVLRRLAQEPPARLLHC